MERGRDLARLCSIFGLIIIWIPAEAFAKHCPPIQPPKGVQLSCSDPETGVSISCSSELPSGAVANYECAKFYTRPIGESESGRLECGSNGVWNRHAQYEDFKCKLDCGRETSALRGTSSVIVFGEVATRENFPWHVGIFRSNGPRTPFQYFCGGSLTNPTNRGLLVVTAAHCVTAGSRTMRIRPLGDFRVVLGPVSSNYLANELASGTQIHKVKGIKLHPNYNYDTIQNDIALIKLEGRVDVSEFVAPICFPTSDMANMQVTGTGFIAGFGVDETAHISETLNFAPLPVKENSVCNRALGKELTSIEFCAGTPTGKSICSGDSGGGMVFKNELTKRYFIQGIASNVDRRPLQELKYCQNYNTFARVSSFVDWVQAQLDDFFLEEAEEEDEGETRRPPRPNRPPTGSITQNTSFIITEFQDFSTHPWGNSTKWQMRNCSSLPQHWNNKRTWIDVHGKCVALFDGKFCNGLSRLLTPTSQSSIFHLNFPNFVMKTASLCPKGQEGGPSATPTTEPTPSGGGSEGVSGGGATQYDYAQVGLSRHNLYRTKHGVGPLILNESLSLGATSYAYDLLTKTGLHPSGKGGENLFEITGSEESFSAILVRAVDLWYKTMGEYDWNAPKATSFSQLVWKGTLELGVGVARSGRRTVVVARYFPPGNIYFLGSGGDRTMFRENVLPPRK